MIIEINDNDDLKTRCEKWKQTAEHYKALYESASKTCGEYGLALDEAIKTIKIATASQHTTIECLKGLSLKNENENRTS